MESSSIEDCSNISQELTEPAEHLPPPGPAPELLDEELHAGDWSEQDLHDPAKPLPRYRIGYAFFLLTTATLFLRPGEVVVATEGWPIFQVLVIGALVAAYPAVLAQLHWARLMRFPAVLCVLGMTVAIFMSLAMNFDFYGARMGAADFMKVAMFFLLLVGLVNTVPRLRGFLMFTTLMIVGMAILATLGYYGLIHMHSVNVISRGDGGLDANGQEIVFRQLQASGIFSDPNDFALVLVMALLGAFYFITEAKSYFLRFLWLWPAAMLAFAFALTKSRGGLLSLLAGVTIWLISRFGAKRASVLLVLVMPAIFVAFAGRQTNINLDADDTAQSRIRLWRDGIEFIKSAPVFGIGYNQYTLHSDNVAHNSYLHCYAELGFLGGTIFLGTFLLPLVAISSAKTKTWLLWAGQILLPPREDKEPEDLVIRPLDPEMDHLRSTLIAIGIAYAVGLFSLSRSYACSTYLMLGMLCAMQVLIAAKRPRSVPRLTSRLVGTLVVVSFFWLSFLFVFVHVMVKAAGKHGG